MCSSDLDDDDDTRGYFVPVVTISTGMLADLLFAIIMQFQEIGRASCRERV